MSFGSGGFSNPPPWSRQSNSTHCSNSSSYQNLGNVAYPIKRPHSPDDYTSSYQQSASLSKGKSLNGYVTKLYDSWGVIDNEIQFSFSACMKGIPKLKDHVLAEVIHTPGTTYKWRAVKVSVISNGRDYSNLKPVINSRTETEYRRARGLDRSRERSRERRFDDVDRKRFKRDDKEDKFRDLDKDSFKEREKFRDHDKSPIRRSRSPVKRKLIRYAVKVPVDLLTLSEGDIITLKKRYPALYIPSDFFTSRFHWLETFSITKPYSLNKPCNFHIMHKDCDPYIKNDAILDPPDLDYTFSAKVMLMSIPRLDEIYKKTICLAEDLHKEDDRNFTHLSRLIHFLVGSRGKNEPLAIGGPWSPSLDGENPEKDPSVLIKTAIRTCRALTGIDLSVCSQWYRFMEVYYHRSESVHKGKIVPARVETVVIFLPEVWNCVPSNLEWDSVILNYEKLHQDKLHPKKIDERTNNSKPGDQAEESDKEEDLVVIDKCEEKIEPTHYSELDVKNMKVTDLRQELEARSVSSKGLKQDLVERLEAALKKEKNMEEGGSTLNTEKIEKGHENSNTNGNLKVDDNVKEDSQNESKKDLSDTKGTEIVDPVIMEKRYALPDIPHVVVHPSRTAKGGKFDCLTMSLVNLLDYRPNENKEHSFELFLFAELFQEMLQRDFGFLIYKALCEVPEKPKDDKDDKDQKKNEKDTSKLTSPEKTNKLEESEESTQNDSKNVKEKLMKSEMNDSKINEEKIENDVKSEEIKKKERLKLVTKDPHLLLAFVFFDRTHCGYIFDKDLEAIIFCLGLQLSRHQVKKLIFKVAVRETVHYRKLTDKSEFDENQTETLDITSIVLGNRKFFPVFQTEESTKISSLEKTHECANLSTSKSRAIVCFDGAVVDVEKVTTNLEKSELLRLELENQLLKSKKEIDGLRESLKRLTEKEKRLNDDFKSCRDKLTAANKDKISHSNKSRTYYKLLMNIKDQIILIEEKPEKNILKSVKTNEKIDDKVVSSKIKKELPDDNINNEKSDTSDQEKKNCDDVIVKNSNENITDIEASSEMLFESVAPEPEPSIT